MHPHDFSGLGIDAGMARVTTLAVHMVLTELRKIALQLEHVRRNLPPNLVTPKAAAAVLGISLSTIRRQIKSGVIPSQRVGRRLLVDVSRLHPATPEEVEAEVQIILRR